MSDSGNVTSAMNNLVSQFNEVRKIKNIDMQNIYETINQIVSYCREIESLKERVSSNYEFEKNRITKEADEIIEDMAQKFNSYIDQNFGSVSRKIEGIIELLSNDYKAELKVAEQSKNKIKEDLCLNSFQDNEKKLYSSIEQINDCITKLNNFDFDKAVPPKEYRDNGNETFSVITNGHTQIFTCDSFEQNEIFDPKPLKNIAVLIFKYSVMALCCLEVLSNQYREEFNVDKFNSHVRSNAKAWLAESKAKQDSIYNKRFNKLFVSGEETIKESFFEKIAEMGQDFVPDYMYGSDTFKEKITIGNLNLFVTDKPSYLDYISQSPVLSKYIKNGYLSTPFILELNKQGNILLNIDEENFYDSTVSFVNQLLIEFLLSFPANRINFCLIDIDNKMGFSQFKSLTKINSNILFNGIVRDDRQLENTIKDMEQIMYKVDDDILSYNNVENIYEYNRRFEANPQNVNVFVLVNFPSGMREDTAKRVLKILQGGNRTGIFTILINNKACQLTPGYKENEYNAFIKAASDCSLVINKNYNTFTFTQPAKNEFVPLDGFTLSILPGIVDMLKENAESSRQKVVPLSKMFEDTDAAEKSKKGIVPSEIALDIPIGARGGEVQTLCIKTTTDGDAHTVVIGGTGSGKSNLLHMIIMSACYKYSPEELNIYLVDFKGGVEFKFYEANGDVSKQLPHIKLIGLTNAPEDGVAILRNLEKDLKQRENILRSFGAEDIMQYCAKGKRLPRLLVIIDEIQELFERDEQLGQQAINILSELVKNGRALGINILWASQNIPHAAGLKSKVLTQMGNRISLRLNEPDEAIDIKIDPKVVKNLNRPEKGLGVIGDRRYGNDSFEFRVAYAETSENRRQYAQAIIEKWRAVTAGKTQEPLFIVGEDGEPSPIAGNTIYVQELLQENVISKSSKSYAIQLGQDYVTGKPLNINLPISSVNKTNIVISGYDVEVLRDMMGYSLLSVLLNQATNADCISVPTKIYYANGEMINPDNSDDLYNIIKDDFADEIENVTSATKFLECIKATYKLYKTRSINFDNAKYEAYTPQFIVIHSMQRYTDLFNENPKIKFNEGINDTTSVPQAQESSQDKLSALRDIGAMFKGPTTVASTSTSAKGLPDCINFADAFKELFDRGGALGIHFIMSIDNPLGISAIKNSVPECLYKVFIKGINANIVSQMIGDYKFANSLNNPRIALLADHDERLKMLIYRYSSNQDAKWYKELCDKYKVFKRGEM